MEFTTQHFIALLPLLITSATVVLVMLAIAWKRNHTLTFGLSVLGLNLALLSLLPALGVTPIEVTPLLLVDKFACYYMALVLAATLACGYLGIQEKLQPTEPLAGSAHAKGYDLPRSLEEAIAALRACKPLRNLLGERFVRAYTAVKDKEHQTYLRVISSWEREFLLLNV